MEPVAITTLASFRPNTRWLVEYMRLTDKNWRGVRDVDAMVRKIDNEITANRAQTNAEIHRGMYPQLAPFSTYVDKQNRRAYLSNEQVHQVHVESGTVRSADKTVGLPDEAGWETLEPLVKEP